MTEAGLAPVHPMETGGLIQRSLLGEQTFERRKKKESERQPISGGLSPHSEHQIVEWDL